MSSERKKQSEYNRNTESREKAVVPLSPRTIFPRDETFHSAGNLAFFRGNSRNRWLPNTEKELYSSNEPRAKTFRDFYVATGADISIRRWHLPFLKQTPEVLVLSMPRKVNSTSLWRADKQIPGSFPMMNIAYPHSRFFFFRNIFESILLRPIRALADNWTNLLILICCLKNVKKKKKFCAKIFVLFRSASSVQSIIFFKR